MVIPMEDTLTATTPAQARLLLSLRAGRVLGALLEAGPQSAAEVARAAEQPLSQAHRTLGQLLGADLIVLAGTRPRAGRPCKLYAARAETYQVPFALTDAATIREMMAAQYRPFFEAFLEHQARMIQAQGRDTIRLQQKGGQLNYSLLKPEGQQFTPDFYGFFAALVLTAEQAQTLQAELRRLGETAHRAGPPEGQPYLLGLLFSPGELED